jgi:F-type H+-transporting ATPase subunit gamma
MIYNQQQLKNRIKTADMISQISKAMEMISASKIRKAQKFIEKHNPCVEKIKIIIKRILSNKIFYDCSNKIIKSKGEKRLIFVVSPDKGLVGGLIVNLLKKMKDYVNSNDYIVTIGKKCATALIKYGYNIYASFNFGYNFPRYSDLYSIVDIIKFFYFSDKVIEIDVLYPKFKNLFMYEIEIEKIFPIKIDKYSKINYNFEQKPQKIFEDLLPFYIDVEFYSILINAYASEQAARMISMRNAKNNATDISMSLTNIYNKSRQEKITNEILYLATGR